MAFQPLIKKIAGTLASLLGNDFNALLRQHAFGSDTLTANISMIKPNTYIPAWSNYWPTSLLNIYISKF